MEFSDTTTFRELAAFLTSPQCERINKVYATVEHETEIYTMKGNNPGAELNASSLIHKYLPHHTAKLPKKKATAPVARVIQILYDLDIHLIKVKVAVVFVSKQQLVDSEEDEEFAMHTSSRRKVSCQSPEVKRSRSLPTGSSAVRMVGHVPAIVSENQFLCFGKGNITQYFDDFLKNHKCSNLCVEVGVADEMNNKTE
ncbi:hypothetical protein BCR33DRAFT_735817 [Rhizoclosmatium globosum]|uniref:Alpha-type protein kinase domain-containing protein n=1 Tax=Rhizoclosmatium globosum TaxID=329046 RepID=A0A1Y2CKX7_9FUNG|nr:hypothetical protein BCR33DRAFT_735817 [Rhizoclosmatium globosum]|eukprot:ORY47617.1 hypothetical protein BCR33DRAFT_735817 [Rhizoclosmatium globosum]